LHIFHIFLHESSHAARAALNLGFELVLVDLHNYKIISRAMSDHTTSRGGGGIIGMKDKLPFLMGNKRSIYLTLLCGLAFVHGISFEDDTVLTVKQKWALDEVIIDFKILAK
jgi:hypothetical protein